MPEPESGGQLATGRPQPRSHKDFLGPYRDVLAAPGAPRLALASLMSKWPISMFPVSALLLVSRHYSYTQAGTVVAVMLLANGVTSPIRGLQTVRRGARTVLRTCLAGYLVGVTGISVGAACAAPLPIILAAALLMGMFFPPASTLLRSHWTAQDRVRGQTSANALESALMDLSLVTGPIVASWLSASFAPVLPLALIGVLMAVAVVLLDHLPDRMAAPSSGPGNACGVLRTPLVSLLGAQFLFCAALAATEVSLPVYAQQHQAAFASGWLLAGLSVGSIVGALALGGLHGCAFTRLPLLLLLLAAGMCAIGAAMMFHPVTVGLVCVPAGFAIGSVFARFFTILGSVTPPGADREVQGWANSMTTIGFAVGSFGGAALGDMFGGPALLLFAPFSAVVAAGLTARSEKTGVTA
ncbi:MFS transporter [Streptomyces sp. NPDC088747]|uniref:MFS transporter n=1 Tax=Streptomyces sp. NPDC088747 TaxID=3365886 RepID=UPI0037F76416